MTVGKILFLLYLYYKSNRYLRLDYLCFVNKTKRMNPKEKYPRTEHWSEKMTIFVGESGEKSWFGKEGILSSKQ
jgi:hypothetical protein